MRIVLKIGGNVLLDPAQLRSITSEVGALQKAGHQLLLVHGGGPQLDAAIAELGEAVQKIDGLRVTSVPAAAVVQRVLDGIGADLAAKLVAAGLPAAHVPSTARCLAARVKSEPLGRVGSVIKFAPPKKQLPVGIPVVTPVGFDAAGPLNVNADEGAAAVAVWAGADLLVLATDVSAVRGANGQDLKRLTPPQARALMGSAAKGGMIPKLGNAIEAIQSGVRRVLITKLEPGLVVAAAAGKPTPGTLVEA